MTSTPAASAPGIALGFSVLTVTFDPGEHADTHRSIRTVATFVARDSRVKKDDPSTIFIRLAMSSSSRLVPNAYLSDYFLKDNMEI